MIVFLDCGFHHGEHLPWFLKKYGEQDHKYYGFEANPELASQDFFPDSKIKNFKFIGKAVSTKNGKRMFNIMEKTEQSSFYAKSYGKVLKTVEIDTIDFSEWVQENVDPKDYVILKLDIEGEEYPLLEKMVTDGTIQLIDDLYCEFHDKKVRSMNGINKLDLIKAIQRKGCRLRGNQ